MPPTLILGFIFGILFALIIGALLVAHVKNKKIKLLGILLFVPAILMVFSIKSGIPFLIKGTEDTYLEKDAEFHRIPSGVWYWSAWRNYTNGSTRIVRKLTPESWNVTVFHNSEPWYLEVGVVGIKNEIVFANVVGQTNYQDNPVNMLTGITTDSFYRYRKILPDTPMRYEIDTNSLIAELKSKGVTLWDITSFPKIMKN